MILGIILICGMGPATPGAINGCLVRTRPFTELAECESEMRNPLTLPALTAGQYFADARCIAMGTGA